MYKIALFTPLSPVKSGISYFSEDILPLLGQKYLIDIFVDNIKPDNKDISTLFNIFDISEYENRKNNYDINIYQMGNNPCHLGFIPYIKEYPGIVVMHDYSIHHIYANKYLVQEKNQNEYLDIIEKNYGNNIRDDALQRLTNGKPGLWDTNAIDYPMNNEIIDNSVALIVFSDFVKSKIEEKCDYLPVFKSYLYSGEEDLTLKRKEVENAKSNLGFNKNDVLLCAFGFIQPSKRPLEIIKAFSKINNKKAVLVFVGELNKTIKKSLLKMIKDLGLEKRVVITGFVDEPVFKEYLKACDINIALRYPTMGETSGVLMRALAYGKPSIVTNIGSFAELDDNIVHKVSYLESEVHEIYEGFNTLLKSKKLYNNMSKKASSFASKNLTISIVCNNMINFIDEIIKIQEIIKSETFNSIISDITKNIVELNLDIELVDYCSTTLTDIF